MIFGIGVDIVEIKRIQHSFQKNNRFVERVLTKKEKQLFEKLESDKRKYEFLAGRFASKEACAKALGTGIGKVSFQDIEILRNTYGAPILFIHHSSFSHLKTYISISHSDLYAVSQVVLTKKDKLEK